MVKGNIVNWFEIPVIDFDRAKKFYESIFDIKMESSILHNYKIAFFPAIADKTSGAICFGEGYIPSGAGTLIYLNANPDLNLVLDKVTTNHGRILVPKTLINEANGYYAFILDTEGNRIALHSDR